MTRAAVAAEAHSIRLSDSSMLAATADRVTAHNAYAERLGLGWYVETRSLLARVKPDAGVISPTQPAGGSRRQGQRGLLLRRATSCSLISSCSIASSKRRRRRENAETGGSMVVHKAAKTGQIVRADQEAES